MDHLNVNLDRSSFKDFTSPDPNAKGPTPNNPASVGVFFQVLHLRQELIETTPYVELPIITAVDGNQDILRIQISPTGFGIGSFAEVQIGPRCVGKVGNIELQSRQIDDFAILKALDVIHRHRPTNAIASAQFRCQDCKGFFGWRDCWFCGGRFGWILCWLDCRHGRGRFRRLLGRAVGRCYQGGGAWSLARGSGWPARRSTTGHQCGNVRGGRRCRRLCSTSHRWLV
mmetsp:Transcript_14226/g.35699  ORF Transcript_14226/g.35699 Transcript_14226/m.35699 type:complete len:228 (+) Transcript_14226:55-738(+)